MKNSEKAVSNSRFHQNIRVFFSRGFMSKICFGIIIVFVVLAVLAPVLAPYPPTEQSLTEALQKPSATHWFGTDNLGRDLLSRILYGARISLISSLLSSLIAAAIGTFLGLVAGYFGGLLSQVIMRVIDAQLSIPPLVLTIVLAMVFGGGITGVSVVIVHVPIICPCFLCAGAGAERERLRYGSAAGGPERTENYVYTPSAQLLPVPNRPVYHESGYRDYAGGFHELSGGGHHTANPSLGQHGVRGIQIFGFKSGDCASAGHLRAFGGYFIQYCG